MTTDEENMLIVPIIFFLALVLYFENLLNRVFME